MIAVNQSCRDGFRTRHGASLDSRFRGLQRPDFRGNQRHMGWDRGGVYVVDDACVFAHRVEHHSDNRLLGTIQRVQGRWT